jgi:Chaperone of endosialidase
MHRLNRSTHRRLAGITAAVALTAIAHVALAQQSENAAYGAYALGSVTTGGANAGFGFGALTSNSSGWANTAVGWNALAYNTTGYENTASGSGSLFLNNGWGNTAIGNQSLYYNVIGHNNVAVGNNAGYEVKGSNNIHIGNTGEAGDNNTMRLGGDSQNRVFIAGIYGKTASSGLQVYINSAGQLGTVQSSERFKKDIKSIDGISEKLLQLHPVSFIYREDDNNELQYGLIAEEVAKVYPELVKYDQEGKPFTVYYNFLTPLLLSELQKEHAVNTAQQATLTTQQAQLADMNQQLITQRAEMLALMQQHVTEMAALQKKLNQLDTLLQANGSNRVPSERVAMTPNHQ